MKNFLVIFYLTTAFSLSAQQRCIESEEIFIVTEEMPISSPDFPLIEELINNQFTPSKCELIDGDKIFVQLIINCKGEDFDYVTRKFSKDTIDCGIDNFLQSNLSWTPAKTMGRTVDFTGTIVFEIKENRFILLSESISNLKDSKRKNNKRRRKK